MFSRHNELVLPDLSTDLADEHDWKVGALRTLDFPMNTTAIAVEPVAGLLAAGTADGSIHIFGRPGVHCKITLPDPAEVRLLQFSVSTYNIVCLDGKNQMHIYNLLEFGRPKLVSSARYDQTNSITLSPSHTHVFVATQNGDIKTYDLTCLRKSPYNTPNLWKLYEEKMVASGVPSLVHFAPTNAVDCVIHPRNLDLMLVAYSGGVVLTGLTERSTIRAYELVLTPGAPGGARHGDILTHRRMMVTSIAAHPSGHFFVVGHADGSIAFWAVEDDNKPLLVRTLDAVDVNLVDASALDQEASGPLREPIFKLSWSSFPNSSDPRGGDTVLTVLGGLNSDNPPGLTVFLLPAFNPTEPPSEPAAPPDSLHPFFRSAMRESLTPKKTFFYGTFGVVQDYLLIPRSSPHFSGNFDPYAILLIIESDNMRTVESYQFPPPGFIQQSAQPHSMEDVEQDEKDEEMPNSANSGMLSPPPPPPLPKSPRHLNNAPLQFRMPVPLLCGSSGILGGQLIKLDNEIYQDFVKKSGNDHTLDFKGGQAYADIDKMNELKLSKYQPHRIVVTHNRDLSVRFFDISTQLLIPSPTTDLVEHEWPEPLPALNVHLDELFDDAELVEYISCPPDKIAIQSVQVATDALECAIALKSGEIVVCHPAFNRPVTSSPKVLSDTEIILLDHLEPLLGSRLTPSFIFAPGKGPVETYALSDVGFLAASYKDGSLFVIDMRGPKIIFSQLMDKKSKRASILPQGHISLSSSHGSGPDVVKSLAWTISPLENDPQLRVRLIAARQSGEADIYTLSASGNPMSWGISGEPVASKAIPDPLPDGIFVLDIKGARCKADRTHLSATFKNTPATSLPTGGLGSAGNRNSNTQRQNILITVGAKGARSTANLNGDKVGKVEWGNKVGGVSGVQVVDHLDSRALVVQTDRHDALIYTLPHLEYICTLQLSPITSLPLSIDESGDYLAWALSPQARTSGVIHSATYGTLFDIRRAYTLPDIDFASSRGPVPPQPQPVSLGPPSVLGYWFSFNQTKTGEQIDALLGGPDRPIPEKKEVESSDATGPGLAGSASGAASNLVAGAAAVQANLYNRLASALNERGQMLGDLEERFNSLEEGSRSMVAQAKRLATQSAAKSWFGF
ncbi:lethal giant larvae like, C-terminal-domain-containing protein [Gymnopilus junonius]|uniref:Lethal giant larvae like, C-terminal-domain-containing protein n=1 Tax=Gymnopilus junonius TaxID=109634 RepID=A0A9P5NZ14_GYMJU|nr:lethal giant larvae like, C-terminal-domain-containing protein [Gymnopilus junonius]